jgi:stage II sporulation protein GA (sporulation sigma-E factor processing peptidase)
MVVYADLFFLTNWSMDYLLLWATARFAGVHARWWRLAASSVLGAAYATAFLLPAARSLYTASAKAVFSLVMVAVAFPVRSLVHLGRLWGCFVVLSLTAGGGALALAYLCLPGLGGPFPGIPSWLVGLAVAVTLAMAARAWDWRRQQDSLAVVSAEVTLGGRRVTFPALVDTGNRLRDPFSGVPVLVIEYRTARRLLPETLQPLLLGRAERDDVSHPLAGRFRIIPFKALGGQRGILYGFRPDRVRVQVDRGWRPVRPVVVGVCPDVLSPDGWYRGLLPREVLAPPDADGGGGAS